MDTHGGGVSGPYSQGNAKPTPAYHPVLPLLGLLCFLYFAGRGLDLFWWKPRRLEKCFSAQGIRGPPYRFFFGNVKEMVALMARAAAAKPLAPPWSHDVLSKALAFYPYWKKIYGPTFLLWFGPTARLVVSEPEMIREIMVAKSDVYEKYESHPLVRQLEGDGLLSLTGDKWAQHRRIIAPTFHNSNLKSLVPAIARMLENMADKWAVTASSAPSREVEVDVFEWFQGLAEDAVAQATFGPSSVAGGHAIFRMQARQMELAAEAFSTVFIPGYRFLPTQKNRDSWRLEREINGSLVGLIASRARMREKKNGLLPVDLLGRLLVGSRSVNNDPPPLTVNDMVEECKTFFFAGKHTTSNLLTWATVMLAMHPEWQDRARDEVTRVCDRRGGEVTAEHVAQLKTIGMVINETLRLYPPAVAAIRRAKTDATLSSSTKILIPRDTELLIPILAVHHNPDIWGADAAQFNPARFQQGDNSCTTTRHHMAAFMPFGLGGRACVGQNLATMEAKLALAVLLRRFQFRVSPKYVHSPTVLMLLYPQYGAPIIFKPLEEGKVGRICC